MPRSARPAATRRKPVPFLRMSGQWLRDIGFPIGTRVTVEAKMGQLVITAVKERGQRPASLCVRRVVGRLLLRQADELHEIGRKLPLPVMKPLPSVAPQGGLS